MILHVSRVLADSIEVQDRKMLVETVNDLYRDFDLACEVKELL